MYAVQTLNVAGDRWSTVRKFYDWHEAHEYAYHLRRDGHDARVVDA